MTDQIYNPTRSRLAKNATVGTGRKVHRRTVENFDRTLCGQTRDLRATSAYVDCSKCEAAIENLRSAS